MAASRSRMKSAAARSTSGERSRPWFQRLDLRESHSAASGVSTSDFRKGSRVKKCAW
ncbi:hypothetical protein D3C83_322060 [compost metagenome]